MTSNDIGENSSRKKDSTSETLPKRQPSSKYFNLIRKNLLQLPTNDIKKYFLVKTNLQNSDSQREASQAETQESRLLAKTNIFQEISSNSWERRPVSTTKIDVEEASGFHENDGENSGMEYDYSGWYGNKDYYGELYDNTLTEDPDMYFNPSGNEIHRIVGPWGEVYIKGDYYISWNLNARHLTGHSTSLRHTSAAQFPKDRGKLKQAEVHFHSEAIQAILSQHSTVSPLHETSCSCCPPVHKENVEE